MVKFELPNPKKGKVVINNKYAFVDGVFPCSDSDAVKIGPILTRFYGCTKLSERPAKAEKADDKTDAAPTLKAEVTKVEAAKK